MSFAPGVCALMVTNFNCKPFQRALQHCCHWLDEELKLLWGLQCLYYSCVGDEADSPFMRCCKKVACVLWLVELLARICGKGNSLGDKSLLDYFIVPVRADREPFLDRHEYLTATKISTWVCVPVIGRPRHLLNVIMLKFFYFHLVIIL